MVELPPGAAVFLSNKRNQSRRGPHDIELETLLADQPDVSFYLR
jgi:hypothetical protein